MNPAPDRLFRASGSFPVESMSAADLARGALQLVARDGPAGFALDELVRRFDSGEIVERRELRELIDDAVADAETEWAESERWDPNR